MRVITAKELTTYKILPFDLYNESNHKILSAGEVLTPGKLIMLKNYPKLYTEELYAEGSKEEKTSTEKANAKKLSNFSYDTLDINEFETVANRENVLKSEIQIKLKYYYKKTYENS